MTVLLYFLIILVSVLIGAVLALARYFPEALQNILAALQKLARQNADLYRKRNYLFTKGEQAFLATLEQAVGNRYRIFGKVRLADLIDTRIGLCASERQRAWNRIQSKHVDFVLCDPSTLEPLAVIELDDSSHSRPSRRERDDFLDSALASAGLHLIRIPAATAYTPTDLAARLTSVSVAPAPALYGSAIAAGATEPVDNSSGTTIRTCPCCGAPMVLRMAKKGRNAGQQFWGCSRWPDCTAAIDA